MKKRRRQDEDSEEDTDEEEVDSETISEAGQDSDAAGVEEVSEEEEEELEPKVLPERATRGSRLNKLLDEEDSADDEFWNQEFFAEETKDQEFSASESEQEDIPDSDFSESEDDDSEDDDEVEARTRREERRKRKVLKPPGQTSKRPAPVKVPKPAKPATKTASPISPLSPGTQAALKAAEQADAEVQAPTLRRSTKQRTEEAVKERERVEKKKPKRKRQEQQYRPLTQEELLAEAAQTEIENLRSLEIMQAIEEEVKKRAAVKRARFSGPFIRYHSKEVNGESLMTCEVANMLVPPEMKKRKAPPPKPQQLCAITGRPAKYRDPATGLPYFDAAAFKALRQNHQFSGMSQVWNGVDIAQQNGSMPTRLRPGISNQQYIDFQRT